MSPKRKPVSHAAPLLLDRLCGLAVYRLYLHALLSPKQKEANFLQGSSTAVIMMRKVILVCLMLNLAPVSGLGWLLDWLGFSDPEPDVITDLDEIHMDARKYTGRCKYVSQPFTADDGDDTVS
ncbi:hypothetical protein ElyMa_003386200 [Elysia marginata]|uniref:Uncharacterized protein n=1 Tax=Elysia marginata TaxID=1093978 RepID=A0AAV4JKD7_9GAST|nr:hypothetical protein ElyMa_003386200 [Elysia marginata]